MNIDSITTAYANAVDSAMPLIDDSLKTIRNAEREQDDVLAAIRGGSTSFGSESEAKRSYSTRTREASNRGMSAVEKLRDSMRMVKDEALSFDPGEIAVVAPALALKGLTDDDLRALAKRYRDNRGALMAIARYEGSFAANISVALDDFVATISEACRKAGDFAERSLFGQNGIRDGETLRSYLDDQNDAIRKAWETLQGVIDGVTAADSLITTLRHASGRL